ncbi:replication factor C large subunit [Archaeoglobus sulfaticallidus PM70-1]|uniref:Replication factor C large subunit n=1 Tax=Archaeoglobus sulfaticallidus PM70-1 TaxID=387631 RepID=N0BEH6_9EURY|nr:replication factor C large subunit [Archaeoglobus sulfaticallidus]AGK60672.1 replication factor C large subunit [Archaeoglobus sulfaticallidus PM70-1]
MLWVEKYRPKTLSDVVAEKKVISEIKKWAETFDSHRKPLLLAGPPGVGKTSLALAIANTYGWEAVEMNASDQRNWEIITRIVGEGAFSETLSESGEFLRSSEKRRKVIILDEVDNIHKREDAGGERALIRIIKKKPPQPLILIANDLYALSKELRGLCKLIQFRRLNVRSIAKVLKRICSIEGIKVEEGVLEEIAKNSGGDLRAAINDLQAVCEGKEFVKLEDLAIAKRTQETDVFKVLQMIFKTDNDAYSASMLLDETPEDFIWWVSENIPLEMDGEELFRALSRLSRADIFLGRVRRRQFYRLWKYAGYLMTTGIQVIKKERKGGFTRYKTPSFWMKLGYSRGRREKLKKVLAKIGKHSHMSMKKAHNEMFYLIKALMERLDDERCARISAFYEFDKEDLEFLTNAKKAERIIKIIEEKNLHMVDESNILDGFERFERKKRETERAEKADGDTNRKDVKTKGKKVKEMTLDSFF